MASLSLTEDQGGSLNSVTTFPVGSAGVPIVSKTRGLDDQIA